MTTVRGPKAWSTGCEEMANMLNCQVYQPDRRITFVTDRDLVVRSTGIGGVPECALRFSLGPQ